MRRMFHPETYKFFDRRNVSTSHNILIYLVLFFTNSGRAAVASPSSPTRAHESTLESHRFHTDIDPSPTRRLSFDACLSTLSGMAALPITAQVPLFADPHGTLRVQGTRVTLDS